MKLEDLNQEYDKMQQEYGAQELDSIYNGGCITNPDICFVFMTPTGKNIASVKSWHGRKSPWLGTQNIWKLFYNVNLLTENTYQQIMNKKPKDWDYAFCDYVYNELEQKKVFITNLGKCTQVDARPLSDEVLNKYLDLLLKEIDIVKPKVIITFGNQVSSIILNTKISVSQSRKTPYELNINKTKYKFIPFIILWEMVSLILIKLLKILNGLLIKNYEYCDIIASKKEGHAMSDLEIAQNIVSRNYQNTSNGKAFHNTSVIYRTSNERICDYIEYLKNKKKMLSVIASGDKILNSILVNSFNIDAFDISTFPKYFLKLKMAAVMALSKKDYLNFICNENVNEEEAFDLYYGVRPYLDNETKEFWDGLLNYFDLSEIYDSLLFSSEQASSNQMISYNPYLQNNNYQELQSKLKHAKINYLTGDISTMPLQDSYDLVNLSNIIYYLEYKTFQRTLDRINLNNQGTIISYLYNTESLAKRNPFNSTEIIKSNNGNHGLLLYKR